MRTRCPLLAAVLALAVLIPGPGVRAQDQENRVGIGVLLPLSGIGAAVAREMKNGMQMVADDVNGRGGVGGRNVYLDIRDTVGRTDHIRGIMNSFVTVKHHPVVVGGIFTDASRLAAQLADGMPLVYIAAAPAADDITMQGYRRVYRVAPPRETWPAGLLELMSRERRIDRVAILSEDSSYGRIVQDAVRAAAADNGWRLGDPVTYRVGDLEPGAAASAALAGRPDAVIVTAFGRDAGRITRALRSAAGEDVVIAGTTGDFAEPRFMGGPAHDREGIMAAAVWWPGTMDGAVRDFVTRYQQRYGEEPGYHAALGHAVMTVAVLALSRSGSTSPDSLTAYLDRTRFKTAFGLVEFQSGGGYQGQNLPPSYVLQWIAGRPEIVWPEGVQTARPVWPWTTDARYPSPMTGSP